MGRVLWVVLFVSSFSFVLGWKLFSVGSLFWSRVDRHRWFGDCIVQKQTLRHLLRKISCDKHAGYYEFFSLSALWSRDGNVGAKIAGHSIRV